jgi:hypothetical protein
MRNQPTQDHIDLAAELVNDEFLTGYELAKRAGVRAQHVYNVFPPTRREADGTIEPGKATSWLAGNLANRK